MAEAQAHSQDFEAATARLRRELFAHCYRMTGSVGEAEDVVQETYLRAWQGFGRFEGRASVRTWMYRIATNACLSAIQRSRHRALPSALAPPASDPYAPALPASAEIAWLEPVPDDLVVDELADPSEVVVARHRVRLALVAALQLLPSRQRAAFVLCEVLDLPAAEAAELLDVSVAAVKSLLQRARARLRDASVCEVELAEPADAGARQVLDRYMAAFERSDAAAIERLLADDAVLEMTGTTTWFSGKATCAPFIRTQAIGQPGDWIMVPVAANGQPAAAAYHRGPDQVRRAFAIVVLSVSGSQLRRITLFATPKLFATFGLSSELPEGPVPALCSVPLRPGTIRK